MAHMTMARTINAGARTKPPPPAPPTFFFLFDFEINPSCASSQDKKKAFNLITAFRHPFLSCHVLSTFQFEMRALCGGGQKSSWSAVPLQSWRHVIFRDKQFSRWHKESRTTSLSPAGLALSQSHTNEMNGPPTTPLFLYTSLPWQTKGLLFEGPRP